MSTLDDARAYARAGLSVIPVRRDGSKAPALPAGHDVLNRRRRATADELAAWFETDPPWAGIGVQCGAASGGLVVLDFEDRRAFDRWAARVNEVAPGCLDSLPIVETPGGGRHVYYRQAGGPVPAGQKFAYRRTDDGDLELICETRGEGHYVVAPGSPADCHPAGVAYRLVRRGWLNVG
jgi:hypothetical protein